MASLPKITDKIHLPTSVTAMATFSRLLRVVVEHEPLTSAASKPLFMAAKEFGIRKKKAKADTHTEGTLKTFGLISYLEDNTFVATPLGEEVAKAFNETGPLVDPDELTRLSLRVVCSWYVDNVGRDIHPGKILLDLLCDDDLDGYVTEHEYTMFLIDNSIKSDSQYADVKKLILDFRSKGASAICDYTETCKTYIFLPAFVNKWKLFKKGRVFDFEKKGGAFRWTMGVAQDDVDESDDEENDEGSKLYSKWAHVTEFRLLPKAKELYLRLNERRCKVMNISGVLQKIVYGAPGTGKSFDTNGKLKDKDGKLVAISYRTTFHPDSDYSTFVGAYKPTMKPLSRVVQDGTTIKHPTYAAGVEEGHKTEQKIIYEFRPQAFMNAYVKAWRELAGLEDNPPKPVVLVIEEINRGNCAQIFGDLFQLLDRDDEGYSSYPIDADADLQAWLAEVEQFGSGLTGIVKPAQIDQDEWGRILKGEKLMLPPNLYIWATMNTSDQSLFPIDSAFKRRWDWKYVPIREGKDPKTEKPFGWTIQFEAAGTVHSFDWWKFLLNINDKIFNVTDSEDKKLGYFFVKPDRSSGRSPSKKDVISDDRFVNKVVFYLWNDVFKDLGIESIFSRKQLTGVEDEHAAKGVAFEEFFEETGEKVNVKTLLKFFAAIGLSEEKAIISPVTETPEQPNPEVPAQPNPEVPPEQPNSEGVPTSAQPSPVAPPQPNPELPPEQPNSEGAPVTPGEEMPANI